MALDFEQALKSGSAIGALIAAFSSTFALYLQFKGKRDRLLVGLGRVTPAIYQESMLHVVSISEHEVTLADWGFVNQAGHFESIPLDAANGDFVDDDYVASGSALLKQFGATFEAGYYRREHPIGAFARTVTQTRPKITFARSAPYWRRAWIRFRLVFQTEYLTW